MKRPWFDAEAFESLCAEQGIPISLCKKEIVSAGNPEYGIKAQISFKCRPVTGHVDRKRALIATSAGSVGAEQVFVYILPKGFSPEEVSKDSYLLIGNVYYQMELVETIYSREDILQYKYKLEKTDATFLK